MQIGRTKRSDFAITEDPHLSSVHFSVECVAGKVVIRDLDSRNGTFVNGVRIQGATLKHGDSISVGKTHFQVTILDASNADSIDKFPPTRTIDTGSRLPSEPQISAANYSQSGFGSYSSPQDDDLGRTGANDLDPEITEMLPPANRLPASNPSSASAAEEGMYPRLSSMSFKDIRKKAGLGSDDFKRHDTPSEHSLNLDPPLYYESRVTSSGLTYFCPGDQEISPTEVIPLLERGRNLYAMINYTQMPAAQQKSFYRDCLARGAMPISESQIIISRQDQLPFDEIVRNAWGRDAVVLITSRKSKIEFVSQAFQIAGKICFPSILLEHLETADLPELKSLLGNFSTLMVERDHGASWSVFKNDNEIRTWKTLGMPCPPVCA